MFIELIFIIFHLSFLFLNYLYYRLKKYYKHIIYKEKKTGKEIDIQDKYACFVPIDKLEYIPFVFVGTIIFPFRIIIAFSIFFFFFFHLMLSKIIYKNHASDKSQRKKIENIIKFWMKLYLFFGNISVEKKEIKYAEIYKKYLGDDYDFENDSTEEPSFYISNHLGFLEIAVYIKEYAVSVLITIETQKIPGLGGFLTELGCQFLNRPDKQSRDDALKFISERQSQDVIKTIVFPEGSTTNGKYILPFKKGVFMNLKAFKPLITFHLDGCICSTNRVLFFFRLLATFRTKCVYAELPIIKPTNFMFENFSTMGKEKWEIYMNVVNKIYSEIGGFIQSKMGHRDRTLYYNIAEDGFYIDK